MKHHLFEKITPVHKRLKITTSPLLVYQKIVKQEKYGFIYESLESIGVRSRYSFVGSKPFLIFRSRGEDCTITRKNETIHEKGDPIEKLKELVRCGQTFPMVRSFSGGAVGYISYDAIRYFEKIPDANPDVLEVPDLYFIFPEEIIVFDHKERTMDLVVFSEGNGEARLNELESKISEEIQDEAVETVKTDESWDFQSNFNKTDFCDIVKRAKEYILAGDIFQVVLSQRLTFPMHTDPVNIYRSLRITNPSPYMYYLHFDGLHVIGSSPETLVKLNGDGVVIRPLAGTRRRGSNFEEDDRLEIELLNDEKECAEHIMLVDLARNDIGRVCQYGSVKVTDLLEIERYSKVMHIVSNVEGKIRENRDCFDLLSATFPAGTVSGSPKIRAMEIIDELEPTRRAIYAGAIGYFSYSGDMDTCIAIRTVIVKDGTGYIQAGAGIVADSDPEREYQETMNKAKALFHAVRMEKKK